MDVRIGVIQTARELDIDMGEDADVEAVQSQIQSALEKGSGLLWLTDKRGRKYGAPVDKISFVEIGSKDEQRKIGFIG